MSKMIQIRNVPDPIHRTIKARAAKAGMSLSDFLLKEVTQTASLPTTEELMERIRSREPVRASESAAKAVRAERESRK